MNNTEWLFIHAILFGQILINNTENRLDQTFYIYNSLTKLFLKIILGGAWRPNHGVSRLLQQEDRNAQYIQGHGQCKFAVP